MGPRWQREREKGEVGPGWLTRGADLSAREERGRRALLGRVGGSGPGRGLLGLSGRNREMGRFSLFFFFSFILNPFSNPF